MDVFFSTWIAVIIIGLVAVVTPGPDFVLILRSSLSFSRQTGICTAIGIGVGNLIHASYTLVGIGAIVSQSILLFNGLKILGAIYLVYLGCKALIAKKKSDINIEIRQSRRNGKTTHWQGFRMGLLANMLNPKATLFFLALFTQVIEPDTAIFAQIIYGSTIAVLALVWFSLVALLISHRSIRDKVFSYSHWMERLTGLVLITLGLRLAFSERA